MRGFFPVGLKEFEAGLVFCCFVLFFGGFFVGFFWGVGGLRGWREPKVLKELSTWHDETVGRGLLCDLWTVV